MWIPLVVAFKHHNKRVSAVSPFVSAKDFSHQIIKCKAVIKKARYYSGPYFIMAFYFTSLANKPLAF
jgi:hypothetical protein